MKLPPNTTLACIYDAHADCLNKDCGCRCHKEPLVDGLGKVRTHIKSEEEYEEAQ